MCLHAEADTGIQPCSSYIVCFCQIVKQQLSCLTQRTWTTMYKQHYVADRIQVILYLRRKHNLTGCEHISGFYGASKKVIAYCLKKSKEAQHLLLLAACGTQLPVTQEVLSDLEQFIIYYVYGDRPTQSRTMRDARAVKWRAKKKKSTIQLVPDSDSLHLHLDRTNYLAYLLKPPKSSLIDWPPVAAGKWPMCACLSTQPHSPIHATTHKARGGEKQWWQRQTCGQWLEQL